MHDVLGKGIVPQPCSAALQGCSIVTMPAQHFSANAHACLLRATGRRHILIAGAASAGRRAALPMLKGLQFARDCANSGHAAHLQEVRKVSVFAHLCGSAPL